MGVTLRDAERFVNRPYVPGRADCMHLAALVQRRLFGRHIGWAQARNPVHPGDQAALVQAWAGQVAQRIDHPETGCAVLFTEDLADGGHQYHVGTVFMRPAEPWVLHAHAAVGHSVLWRLDDCLRAGLRLDGFYRWMETGMKASHGQ